MKKIKILSIIISTIVFNNFCFSQGGIVISDGGADATTNYVTKWEDGGTLKIMNSIIFDDGTNIGIGTTSPNERLEINGSIRGNQSGALRISTGNGFVDVGPMNTSWSHFSTDRSRFYFNRAIYVFQGLFSSYNDNLSLQTSGTTRITVLNNNGNVGIGTASPGATLDVRGSAIFNEAGGDNDFRIESDALTHMLFVDASTNRIGIGLTNPSAQLHVDDDLYIGPSGWLGINDDPGTGGYELYLKGQGYATDGFIDGPSDIRYKKNIKTIVNALDKVMLLRGATFEFRTEEFKDKGFSEGKKLGFIAQEVINILPEVVIQDNEGYYAIKYNGFIPVLTEAIKELKKENDALNAEIENLKNDISQLKVFIGSSENILNK